MPHVVILYTASLDAHTDMTQLCRALADTMLTVRAEDGAQVFPTGGTRVYAWINSDSGNKVYSTVVITGLSSLPQTGQDMTLIYVLGGTAAALIAVAGVWYGIRKKRTVA